MRIWALIVLGLVATPAGAQVALPNPMDELRDACVREAKTGGDTRSYDGRKFFVCAGATAEKFFDVSTRERTVQDKNGVFVARYFGEAGYCAHQTEDANGHPISQFICEVQDPQAN